MNWITILLTALVPMVMGFIWYNPKTLGTAWMQAAGVTEEKMKGANMGAVFGLSYLFSVMLALAISMMVVHQFHMKSILMNEPGITDSTSEISMYLSSFMEKYGNNFRTFKHGAFHGFLGSLFFAFPILATNAMFERKGWKYIWINTGYWTITIALMGGFLCAYV